MCSSPHNRLRHISKQNVSENILKCVCRLRIVSNASQTNWQILPTPRRSRIILLVFLSKYWLMIAIDTLFRRKRDWVPREWFVSPNLPETHFKVKSHHSIFQSTSFNRELRRMRSTNNIFPSRIKYQSNSFIQKRLKTRTGLVLNPEFPRIPSWTKTDSKNFQVLFFRPGTSWNALWCQCFHTPT